MKYEVSLWLAAALLGFCLGGFVGEMMARPAAMQEACATVKCADGEPSVWVQGQCRCLGKPVAP